jgi:hypothetical protein
MTQNCHGAIQQKFLPGGIQGQFQGRTSTSVEGSIMPVFTFEKISPPMRRVPASSSAAEKPRGVLTRLVDRFSAARGRRANSDDQPVQPQPQQQAK